MDPAIEAELRRRLQDPSTSRSDRREISLVLNKEPESFQQVQSSAATAGEFALRNFIDNALSIPNAAGELLAVGSAGVQSGAGAVKNLLTGSDEGPSFRERVASERELFPASALINAPTPNSFDLQAGLKTAVDPVAAAMSPFANLPEGTVSEQFQGNRDQILDSALDRREAQPGAAGVGEVIGDALTMATGRAPLAAASRARRLAPKPPKQPVDPGTKQLLDDLVNSTVVQRLKRGGTRVAETGIEGAVMAALNEEDPLNSAALAAGSQAAGSLFLTGSEGLLGKKGRNLATAAVSTMAFIQLFKTATPGGRDRILESSEAAFDKLAALLALGGLSAVGGFGRASPRLANQVPVFADAITAVPRGAVLSVLSDIGDDSDGNVEAVLMKLSQEPDFFGPTAARRIERALKNPDVSLTDVINTLTTDRGFRRKLSDLQGT